MSTNQNPPRFSAVLARVGEQLAKMPDEERAAYRAKFDAEVTAAEKEKRPVDPIAFLGNGATGQEVAKAFREDYQARGDNHGPAWAREHGAQAFRNFIPAFA